MASSWKREGLIDQDSHCPQEVRSPRVDTDLKHCGRTKNTASTWPVRLPLAVGASRLWKSRRKRQLRPRPSEWPEGGCDDPSVRSPGCSLHDDWPPSCLRELLDGGPGGRHGRATKDKMNSVVTNYMMARTSRHVQMAAFDPRMRKARGE